MILILVHLWSWRPGASSLGMPMHLASDGEPFKPKKPKSWRSLVQVMSFALSKRFIGSLWDPAGWDPSQGRKTHFDKVVGPPILIMGVLTDPMKGHILPTKYHQKNTPHLFQKKRPSKWWWQPMFTTKTIFLGQPSLKVDFWVRWDPLLVARRDLLDLSTRPFSAPTPPSSFRNPLGLQFVWKMASRPCSFMIVKTKWNTSWSASSMLFGKTKKHNVLIQTKWCFRGHGSHSRKDPQKTIISFEYNYHQIQEKKPAKTFPNLKHLSRHWVTSLTRRIWISYLVLLLSPQKAHSKWNSPQFSTEESPSFHPFNRSKLQRLQGNSASHAIRKPQFTASRCRPRWSNSPKRCNAIRQAMASM